MQRVEYEIIIVPTVLCHFCGAETWYVTFWDRKGECAGHELPEKYGSSDMHG